MRFFIVLLCLGIVRSLQAGYTISLTTAKFDPLKEGEPNIPLSLKAKETGTTYYIVQFKGPIFRDWKKQIKKAGAEILAYIPHFALIVKMDKNIKQKIEKLHFVRWVGLFHPYYKISPDFKSSSPPNPRGTYTQSKGWQNWFDPLYINSSNLRSVVLYALPDVKWDNVSSIVMGMGGEVKQITGAPPGRMIAWVPPSMIGELAKIDGIYYIAPYNPKTLWNNTTKYVIQSDVLTVAPDDWPDTTADTVIAGKLPLFDNNIKGQGELITVFDTGADYYSCWFADPEGDPPGPNHIVIEAYTNEGGDLVDTSDCGHGTHVSGTVAGLVSRGGPTGYDDYSGNAYLARLYIQDIGYTDRRGNCALGITDMYTSLGTAYNTYGSRIHTNSWGYTGDGSYQYESIDIDAFTFVNQEMVVTVAAGNDGPTLNTVAPPSTAKNCISVGSTYRESYDSSADTLSDFSSRGLTDDNRFKPEVTAPGGRYPPAGPRGDWREYIFSAFPNSVWGTASCRFAGMMGTSMATPAVAAAAALVREYYREGWYPSGTQNAADGFTPSGALIKATLIVSCEDMNGEDNGTDNPIPNAHEGFGRIKLDSALYFQGDEPQRLAVKDVASLATGQADTYVIDVLSALRPFRMALVWYDTAAAALANPTIINDLDLTLIDPSGTEYHGNQMTNGESDPNPASYDRINTVEFFQLTNPPVGTWKIIVSAYQVATNALQSYAIAAVGDIGSIQLAGYMDYVGSLTALNKKEGIYLKWRGGEPPYSIRRKKEPDEEFVTLLTGLKDNTYLDKNVKKGETYLYKIFDAKNRVVGISKITYRGATALFYSPTPSILKPGESITLSYSLPYETEVLFKVYNTSGRLVRRILVGKQKAGIHTLKWDGKDERGKLLPPGKYLIRMFADGKAGQRTFVIVK